MSFLEGLLSPRQNVIHSVKISPNRSKAFVECFTVEDLRFLFNFYSHHLQNNPERFVFQNHKLFLESLSDDRNCSQPDKLQSLGNLVNEAGRATNENRPPTYSWPSTFEENPGSYRFDKSGWFFEQKTGYYFDFNSKVRTTSN